MPKSRDVIFIGIAGTVLALDRTTGAEIWNSSLKGTDFVNVVLDGDRVLASTRGELYCLDSTTGRILWNNPLKGLGRGLISVATANSPLGSIIPSVEQKRREEEAAASGTAVVVTG